MAAWLGLVFGSLRIPFGVIAATTIDIFILIISVLVTANVPIKVDWPWNDETAKKMKKTFRLLVTGADEEKTAAEKATKKKDTKDDEAQG